MSNRAVVTAQLFAVLALTVAACAGDESVERAEEPDCGEQTGRTVEHPIPGLDSRANRALVHLPPCYDEEDDVYPTVYLMHGGGTTAEMWTSPAIEAPDVIDGLTMDQAFDPVIVVMPYGASGRPEFTGEGGDGEFNQVLAEIDASFRTIPTSAARAVGGVSAGGTTAAYLAAENDSTDFAALGLFMSVWGPSLDERFPAGVLDGVVKPNVLVDIGEDDGLRTYTSDMEAAFSAAGVDAEMQVHPGDHDAAFVAERFPDWITWLASQL